jgi:glutaredoxin-related protein
MFIIYTLSYCGYSKKAIALLQNNNLEHEEVVCDNIRSETDNIASNYYTYPKIFFINKNKKIFIGGKDDFDKILNVYNKLHSVANPINKNDLDLHLMNVKLHIDKNHILEMLLYMTKMIKKIET